MEKSLNTTKSLNIFSDFLKVILVHSSLVAIDPLFVDGLVVAKVAAERLLAAVIHLVPLQGLRRHSQVAVLALELEELSHTCKYDKGDVLLLVIEFEKKLFFCFC
jgi:hypothetical protein